MVSVDSDCNRFDSKVDFVDGCMGKIPFNFYRIHDFGGENHGVCHLLNWHTNYLKLTFTPITFAFGFLACAVSRASF